MNSQQLIRILEGVGGYGHTCPCSGRGMYGKQCVGWVVDTDQMLYFVTNITANLKDEHEREAFADSFRTAKTDNWGRNSTTVYWPQLEWPKEDK